jgi:gamma-glutamyl-gamma-aminobutyrate hydrolase PuuD
MSRPIIGLTMYRERARWGVWDEPADLLPAKYVDAVVASGGVPVLLPVAAPDVDRLLDVIDGVLICGGADVEPTHYDQPAHEAAGPFRPDRDDAELAIARAAVKREVPVLGICRGMQVLNVALGGDLSQHLPDAPGTLAHQESPGVFSSRSVALDADSFLGRTLGPTVPAACHHHQAVDRAADGLRIVGRADDGTPEAFESQETTSGAPAVLGVQWHPERGSDRRLFEAFVSAAATRGR